MNPIPVNIAVEDALSDVVARRLLAATGKNFAVGTVFNRGGFGYLRKTAAGWNNAAQGTPFFLLTDLDQAECPSVLLSRWLPNGIHHNMLARVAVREVEAWLLADAVNFAQFLGVPRRLVPDSPDTILDPKAELVELASRSSRRSIKSRIVPSTGSTAKQGKDYNTCLSEFVTGPWDVAAACLASPSLHRSFVRLREFRPAWA